MEVRCANCGAKIPLQRDDALLRCPFCDSTLYLDRAHTFLRFLLPPVLTEAQAKRRLLEELEKREIPPQEILAADGVLLPFWGKRGGEGVRAEAAFAPLPDALVDFELPSAPAEVSPNEPPAGFSRVACSENAAARWEKDESRGTGMALYESPLFRLSFGPAQKPYEAYVDAVSGAAFISGAPPANTAAISNGSMKALLALFAVVAAEAMVIPGAGLSFLAAAATCGAAFPLLKRKITQRSDS